MNNLSEEEVVKILIDTYFNPATGYCGRDKLYQRVKEHGITVRQVASFLKQNPTHMTSLPPGKQDIVRPIFTSAPQERYVMDCMKFDKHIRSMNADYSILLNVVDAFSGYTWSFACETEEDDEIASHLFPLLEKHPCKILQSDNGSNFTSGLIAEFCKKNNIQQVFSKPYCPRSNAAVERKNGQIRRMVNSYLRYNETDNWVEALPDIIKNLNTSKIIRYPGSAEDIFLGRIKPHIIKELMYDYKMKWVKQPKYDFKKNDLVRIREVVDNEGRLIKDKKMVKASHKQWSEQLYQVIQKSKHKQPRFKIQKYDKVTQQRIDKPEHFTYYTKDFILCE